MKKSLFILMLFMTGSNATACAPGCAPYQGTCACDQRPEVSSLPETKPSEEKPPRDKMPSYQREGIKVDMPISMTAVIQKEIDDKNAADTQGKAAAGIK